MGGSEVRVLRPPEFALIEHTKLLVGIIEGETARNWNALFVLALKRALSEGADPEELNAIFPANIENGHRHDSGFKPIAGYQVSFQGTSAPLALESTYEIVRKLGLKAEVKFSWRNKDGAAFPGEIGVFEF